MAVEEHLDRRRLRPRSTRGRLRRESFDELIERNWILDHALGEVEVVLDQFKSVGGADGDPVFGEHRAVVLPADRVTQEDRNREIFTRDIVEARTREREEVGDTCERDRDRMQIYSLNLVRNQLERLRVRQSGLVARREQPTYGPEQER